MFLHGAVVGKQKLSEDSEDEEGEKCQSLSMDKESWRVKAEGLEETLHLMKREFEEMETYWENKLQVNLLILRGQ